MCTDSSRRETSRHDMVGGLSSGDRDNMRRTVDPRSRMASQPFP